MISNVGSIYCPGCSAGDFPQPHICGVQNQKPFLSPFQIAPMTVALPCDHCFCLRQKQGTYRVPDSYLGTHHFLKTHKLCCMCGARRAKMKPPEPEHA